jgi:adenylosuccinate lyase
MKCLWSEEKKYQKWLEVEVAALEAWSELGKVPPESLQRIKEKASFNVKRIKEIEEEVNHDVIAFVTQVAESVGEEGRYIHYGLTSSDVVDTALSLLMREAAEILLKEAEKLFKSLKEKAFEYRDLLMVGRTHGVHAEPITFGQKLALWTFETHRNMERLRRAKEVISYGKISGAVGNYAHTPPFVEEYVCSKLNLKVAPASSQILQRDRHAEYLSHLAIFGASLEKFAQEIRHLQRTEVLEVLEPFIKGQKGSSAMPHKKNPVLCERICGLARVLRANQQAALENIALWHERDISHSSVERIIIPDSTTLLHYLLRKFQFILENMQINEDKMKENLNLTQGLIFSQRALLALIEKGLSRDEAYAVVQKNAFKTWEGEKSFQENLLSDDDVLKHLTPQEIEEIFDLRSFTRNLKTVFERLQSLEV